MKWFSKILVLTFLGLVNTACNELGEISARKGSQNPPAQQLSVNFWELPQKIAGITFKAKDSGLSGKTTSEGLITCYEKEEVDFFVGSIPIGQAVCSKNITLAEIAGASSSQDSRAVQLLLFLLSLDDDNNSNNGIKIVDSALDYNEEGTVLNLDDPAAVAALIQSLDPGTLVLDPAGISQIIDAVVGGVANIIVTTLLGVPISNLTYTNATGFALITDQTGRITCIQGELITFSLGSLVLGSATCSSAMTLEEIAGSLEAATQLMVILLSLDDDNVPSNGINIVSTANDYIGVTDVDLSNPSDVDEIIQVLDPGTPEVTEEDATNFIESNPPTQGPLPIVIDINELAIVGLTYKNPEGLIRTTDSSGQIICKLGETIRFYVGSVLIGSATCSNSLTLVDVAGGEDESVQLLILLMSLDNDENPNNGINIVDAIDNYNGETTLDLNDPQAVLDLIEDISPGATVATDEEARELLEELTDSTPPIDIRIDGLILEGLSYTTANGQIQTISGNGFISCRPNQNVTFLIGSAEIGSALCSENISLMDISRNSEAALQLVLLLLTLDADENSDNGIEIVDSARNYRSAISVDFFNPISVQNLIASLYPSAPIVSLEEAEDFLFLTEHAKNPKPEVSFKLSNLLIEGLAYKNSLDSLSNTESDGVFYCLLNERIEIFIGTVLLGSVNCRTNTSLFSLADTTSKTTQLLVLLMSLDNDLNTSNGLNLVMSARSYSGTSTLDLENESSTLSLIQELRPGVTPVTNSEALNYLSSFSAIDVLIADTVIEGISYSAEVSGTKTTSGNGLISCIADENLIFKIANIELGSMDCKTKVNFISLAGNYEKAYQLVKILLSFDEDYDSTNGLTLIAEARNYTGDYDLDLNNSNSVQNYINLIRPLANTITNEQIVTILNSSLFVGTISSETIDQTGGMCPQGEASLSKDAEGNIKFDMPVATSELDLTGLIEEVTETTDQSTNLSTLVFPIEDESGAYNILNCTAGGGYSNRVEITIEDVPLNDSTSTVKQSVFKIYQVCNSGIKRIFCQGKFRYD